MACSGGQGLSVSLVEVLDTHLCGKALAWKPLWRVHLDARSYCPWSLSLPSGKMPQGPSAGDPECPVWSGTQLQLLKPGASRFPSAPWSA